MSLEDRERDVRRMIGASMLGEPLTAMFVAVVCNGCGIDVHAPTLAELEPLVVDWQVGENFGDCDYCPECVAPVRQELARTLRRDGSTYQQIGDALGVSRQRAHQLVNPAPRTPAVLRWLRVVRSRS